MIKLYNNGRLEILVDLGTNNFVISDITLRSFIPPQVRKMIPILCQICGCAFCIISKDIKIYLNRFRTNIVTDLQQNYAGRHTRNSACITTSPTHYK